MIESGLPDGSVVKNLSAKAQDAGDAGWIPGSGRSPGEGNSNSLQYSCLKNPMDRGAWWAIVQRVAKSQISFDVFSRLKTLKRAREFSSPLPMLKFCESKKNS